VTEIAFPPSSKYQSIAVNIKIARDEVEIGECEREEIAQLAREGQVLPTDHYWHEGMEGWRLVSELLESEALPAAALPKPIFWNWRRVAAAIVGVAAIATGLGLGLLIFSRASRPEIPRLGVEATTVLERTDTALRTKATNELIAKLDKLPTVASPPSYTFYNDVSIVIPDPPASLTVRIRGRESVLDPATGQVTSHGNFVLTADFQQHKWFFKSYFASDSDFVRGTTTATGKNDQDLVPPAIVSLLGLQVKK
jgi:hypothetical protein